MKRNTNIGELKIETRKRVGEAIRQARTRKGWSLDDVANHFGSEKGCFSKYENGKRLFPVEWVIPFCRFLEVPPLPIAELYFGECRCLN